MTLQQLDSWLAQATANSTLLPQGLVAVLMECQMYWVACPKELKQ